MFHRSSNMQTLSYSNTNWVDCIDSKKSISRYCFFLGSCLIFWKAKKQQTMSKQSYKAKYKVFIFCHIWTNLVVLKDFSVTCFRPPILYCDCQSVLHLASNLIFHEDKTLGDQWSFCSRKRKTRRVSFCSYIPYKKIFLTKALPSPKVQSIPSFPSLADHTQLDGGYWDYTLEHILLFFVI